MVATRSRRSLSESENTDTERAEANEGDTESQPENRVGKKEKSALNRESPSDENEQTSDEEPTGLTNDPENEGGNADDSVKGSVGNPIKAVAHQNRKQPKTEEPRRNHLTKLIPGYKAPMRLGSGPPSGGLEALRKKAMRLDQSTFGSASSRKRVSALKSLNSSESTHFKQGKPTVVRTDAGDGWFGMKSSPMTDELKRDLQVIRNRNYLDPKKFYKSSDATSKFVQVGTVVEGAAEFYSSRLTNKERRGNLVEEIMGDASSSDYVRNKYKRMQQEQTQRFLKRSKKRK